MLKVKMVLGKVILGTIILTTIFSLCFVIAAKMTGSSPNVFGYEILTVLSGSMEPSIKTGSIIVIKEKSPMDTYEAGEVVTFRSKDYNMLVTHRIVSEKIVNDTCQYVTKGDNNNAEDLNYITPEDIVGKYIGVRIPFAGYIFSFLKTKSGIIFLLLISFIVLAVPNLIKSLKIAYKCSVDSKM
ncbi:signal peptidase I [Acetivibrio cellulolyticus]|uniref:signal peptidase I n=1 Tax=Acetivibrio cellulolyticus TaxID=35830 RepID=UPI0001E2F66C|nr:signal peptidase I [Acetivibrio cellulolyticus]